MLAVGTGLTVWAPKPSHSTIILELVEQQQKIIITMTDVTVPIELALELPGQSAAIPHRQNDRDLTKLYFTGDSLDRI